MGTVTAFGHEYQTAIRLDGREVICENLKYVGDGVGRWWNDGETDNGEGAYYTKNEIAQLNNLVPGWRVETYEQDCFALEAALWAAYPSGDGQREYLENSPFNMRRSGGRDGYGDWGYLGQITVLLCAGQNADTVYSWGVGNGGMFPNAFPPGIDDRDPNLFAYPVRLVRGGELPPDPLAGYSEIVLNQAPQPMHQLSLKTESGFFGNNSFSLLQTKQGCSGNVLFKGELGWDFTEVEYPYWVTWWNNTIENGTLPVTFSMCTGAAKLDHTVQFTGPYRVTHDCGTFVVTAPATITNRPSGLASDWDNAYVGPPALYPFAEIGMPQWGYDEEQASTFVATGGLPTAALPLSQRGQKIKFDWKLNGAKFDYLVDWYKKTLNCGKRRFVFGGTLAQGLGPWVCTVVEDPSFSIDGCNFTASMVLFVRPYLLPKQAPVYISDKQTSADCVSLTDVAQNQIGVVVTDKR